MKKLYINIVAISLFSSLAFAQSVNPGEDPNLNQHKDLGSKTTAGVAAVGCLDCIKNQSQVPINRNTNPPLSGSDGKTTEAIKGTR